MRCLKSYFEKARAQRYFYLAVEETLQTTLPIEYSARLDAIVVDMGETPAHDVTRAVEYKTARALAANLLAGYQLNLQTLGQRGSSDAAWTRAATRASRVCGWISRARPKSRSTLRWT